MINQALSLCCAGSRCVKAGNYIPGVLTRVPAGGSQAGQSCRSGPSGRAASSSRSSGNEPASGQEVGQEASPKLLARAPQAATELTLSH